jgi:hypothetical protein
MGDMADERIVAVAEKLADLRPENFRDWNPARGSDGSDDLRPAQWFLCGRQNRVNSTA